MRGDPMSARPAAEARPETSREFIGTYRCAGCRCRVRVYDWLPECVLCRTCQRDIDRQERASEAPAEDES
jgi:hypothetical protein